VPTSCSGAVTFIPVTLETMRASAILFTAFAAISSAGLVKRDTFTDGQPIDPATGKGAPLLGMSNMHFFSWSLLTNNPPTGGTNRQLDLQNPDGLGRQSVDAGTVPNLKWSFSLSKTKIFPGGWTRTQDINDLPQSQDIASAQQHLKKGALRELHWHKVVCVTSWRTSDVPLTEVVVG